MWTVHDRLLDDRNGRMAISQSKEQRRRSKMIKDDHSDVTQSDTQGDNVILPLLRDITFGTYSHLPSNRSSGQKITQITVTKATLSTR